MKTQSREIKKEITYLSFPSGFLRTVEEARGTGVWWIVFSSIRL
jgi:glutamine synthetase type III